MLDLTPITREEMYWDAILKKIEESAIETEEITITQNTTVTAPAGKAYKSVTVNVPSENPNQQTVIYGTLDAPFGSLTQAQLEELLEGIGNNNTLTLTVSVPGMNDYMTDLIFYPAVNDRQGFAWALSEPDENFESTLSAFILWDSAGALIIADFFVIDSQTLTATYTDMISSAAQISTVLAIATHPMPGSD